MAERHSTAYHISPDRQWMMALETQYATMRSLQGLTIQHPFRSLLPALRSADTFAWSKQCVTAAWMASKSIPIESALESNKLPAQAGWWWFDGGLDGGELGAMLWWRNDFDGELACCCFATAQNGDLDPGFSFTWKWGSSVKDLVEAASSPSGDSEPVPQEGLETLVDASRLFLAGCIWLQQRVLTFTGEPVERHRRKQIARECDAIVSDVKVVQLRRAESQSQTSGHEADSVEWSCRWIVNGHWRNQFHPSDKRHELKYILPYVKGPEDKPLKTPTHTVYAVNR